MLPNIQFLDPNNAVSPTLSRADQFQVQLFMHILNRQLRGGEKKWVEYHSLQEEFLKVAHHQHLKMDWKLNLEFLYWLITVHPLTVTKEFADYQCLRATLNWCHTYHEDIETKGIIIYQPYLNSIQEVWIGLKEETPRDKAKIFKASFKEATFLRSLSYAKFLDPFQELKIDSLQWRMLAF